MLAVEALDVRYGTTHAVREVTFEVGAGEAVALLGANAAGKTSTLRAVSGLVPHGGRVVFDGADLRGRPPERIARAGLLHVPEGRRIFPDLTVHENLQIGTTARAGRAGPDLDEMYGLFPPLAALRGRLGFALSGGEQQMVAIARALVGAPRLLLVDEPSLGLSPHLASVVADALRAVRADVPLVVVEQNAHLALHVCGRALVMARGRVVEAVDAAAVDDPDALLDSYLAADPTAEPTADQTDESPAASPAARP